jgi:hypothetical protein
MTAAERKTWQNLRAVFSQSVSRNAPQPALRECGRRAHGRKTQIGRESAARVRVVMLAGPACAAPGDDSCCPLAASEFATTRRQRS